MTRDKKFIPAASGEWAEAYEIARAPITGEDRERAADWGAHRRIAKACLAEQRQSEAAREED